MEITYDKEADAMYIKFKEGEFDANKKIDKYTIADLDKEGNVLGIELLWVSERMPEKSLSDLHIKNIFLS